MATLFRPRLTIARNDASGNFSLQLTSLAMFSTKEKELGLKYYAHAFLFDQDDLTDAISVSLLNGPHLAPDIDTIPRDLELENYAMSDDPISDVSGKKSWRIDLEPEKRFMPLEFPEMVIRTSSKAPSTMTIEAMLDEGAIPVGSDAAPEIDFSSHGDGPLDFYAVIVLSNELNGSVISKSNVLNLREMIPAN